MTGKSHRIIGLLAGGGYYLISTPATYQPATLGAVIIASYLGSLVPDADDAEAEIWHTLPMGQTVGKITDPLLKHRNISHSLVGLLIFSAIIYLIAKSMPAYWGILLWPVFWSSVVAYGSHLLADAFTVEGIPLFWPYKRMFGIPPKPLDGVRIQTGKWFENLVIFPAVNIIFIIMIIFWWAKIRNLIYK